MSLGKRIEDLIKELELDSGNAFSKRLGYKNNTSVTEYINNQTLPGMSFFEKVIQAFPSVDLNWLISGEGTMFKSNILNEPHLQYKLPIVEEYRKTRDHLINANEHLIFENKKLWELVNIDGLKSRTANQGQ